MLKQLIKNTESRVKSYKSLLEEVNKDKISFPIDNEFVNWYKSILRDNKNLEQIVLKRLIEEQTYINNGLNPIYCYKF